MKRVLYKCGVHNNSINDINDDDGDDFILLIKKLINRS